MKQWKFVTLAAGSLALTACGGGSSDGAGGPGVGNPQPTAVSVAGQITGFGSIYVNGIRFDTTGATYEIDDTVGSSDDQLSVGMYVKVSGTLNADGLTGSATSVYYDDEIEGPVRNLMVDPDNAEQILFTIFGTTVIAGPTAVFEAEDDSAYGITTIADGDNVEVSGDWVNGSLFASYIEKQEAGDDEFEVEGTISEYSGGDTFKLRLANDTELDVTLAAGAEIPAGGLTVGLYVEVEGSVPDPLNAPNDLLAISVEIEDEDYFDDDDDEVEVKGPLSQDSADGSWSINGTTISFTSGTSYDPASLATDIADGSAEGRIVEVEGRYVDGVLVADEVEDETNDIEFTAIVDEVNATDAKNGTLTVSFGPVTGGKDGNGRLDVIVNNSTLFMNDDAVVSFDLNNFVAGDFVEVDARLDGAGELVAGVLELEDESEIEIEATVDAVDATSISVLSVVFGWDAGTLFEGGIPTVGDFVELVDIDIDGIADEIEVDDD